MTFDIAKYLYSRLSHKKTSKAFQIVDRSTDHLRPESPDHLATLVSIVIPTRDQSEYLVRCVNSIKHAKSGLDYEIIVVNNQSIETATLNYLERLKSQGHTVIDFDQPFNFSKINNLAASVSKGNYLCFVNNDVNVLSDFWLDQLVDHAKRADVGIVGALMLYPDGKIQHSGLTLGFNGIASSTEQGNQASDYDQTCHEVSGITFACAVISKEKFSRLGGLDERFAVGLNDVDISLSSLNLGYKNVICTSTILEHKEYASRPSMRSLLGATQASLEVLRFLKKHGFVEDRSQSVD